MNEEAVSSTCRAAFFVVCACIFMAIFVFDLDREYYITCLSSDIIENFISCTDSNASDRTEAHTKFGSYSAFVIYETEVISDTLTRFKMKPSFSALIPNTVF